VFEGVPLDVSHVKPEKNRPQTNGLAPGRSLKGRFPAPEAGFSSVPSALKRTDKIKEFKRPPNRALGAGAGEWEIAPA